MLINVVDQFIHTPIIKKPRLDVGHGELLGVSQANRIGLLEVSLPSFTGATPTKY